MKILQAAVSALYYLLEGTITLFRPSQDEYPMIGVQPFSGDPHSGWHSKFGDD
jgi:hypothetical protein